MWEAWEWGYNHVYAGSPSRFNLASLVSSQYRLSCLNCKWWKLGPQTCTRKKKLALLSYRPYLLPILSFSLWAIKIEKCGRHGKSNKAIYVYFPLPLFLSPRPSIPASKLPILALNFNYKELKTKSVGGMDPRLSMYVCLFLSPPFLSKWTKQMFYCFHFSVVNFL